MIIGVDSVYSLVGGAFVATLWKMSNYKKLRVVIDIDRKGKAKIVEFRPNEAPEYVR